MNDNSRSEMERIGNLTIDANGQKIPLNHIAELVSSSGPNTINRENAQRKIASFSRERGRTRPARSGERHPEDRENDVPLPEGYHIEYGGQFESEQAASRILLFTSLISLLVIFLLLFQEFKKVSMAGIIMLNLPLALIGGIFSLWITSGEISIPAIIGFISLLGIATRNGILLVSHYNHLRGEGMSLRESIVQGSLDRLESNPDDRTELGPRTHSAGPAAVTPAGNEIQSPLAKVILGGLLSSTLLNGFIIPTVYLIINRKQEQA
ncbi:MAG: efflux RND transporter permease subunit [Alistipes indistinctus]